MGGISPGFLHHSDESILSLKNKNFTSRPYIRQAYNLHLRGPKALSKYISGFLYLGDHLHNNHHYDPNAIYQDENAIMTAEAAYDL